MRGGDSGDKAFDMEPRLTVPVPQEKEKRLKKHRRCQVCEDGAHSVRIQEMFGFLFLRLLLSDLRDRSSCG